jgi:carboxylesterase type B
MLALRVAETLVGVVTNRPEGFPVGRVDPAADAEVAGVADDGLGAQGSTNSASHDIEQIDRQLAPPGARHSIAQKAGSLGGDDASEDAGRLPRYADEGDRRRRACQAHGSLASGPVVDDELHPWTVEEGLRAGAGREVPLLVGSTRQEFGGLARANTQLFDTWDIGSLLERLDLDPVAARRFAATVPGHHPAEVVGQYVSDVMFRRRIVQWLELRRGAAPTWVYDFAWASAVSGLAEHCLDVPFVFDLLEDPDVTRVAGPDAPQALADRVHAAFVGFIRDREPGWPA